MRILNLLGVALALAWIPGVAAAEDCAQSANGCAAPCPSEPGVGGAGSASEGNDANACPPEEPSVGGAGEVVGEDNTTVISAPEEGAEVKKKADHGGGKGLTIAANGGVEGYTSSLAPRIRAGPSWGATVVAAPSHRVALELQYIGANNRIVDPLAHNARVIRNGGNADIKVALSPTPFEPYIFAGAGFSHANIRNQVPGSGYVNDTFGQIPMGAGFSYHAGNVTAGLRFTFNYLFDRDFTPPTPTGAFGFSQKQGGDIYDGQLLVGGTF